MQNCWCGKKVIKEYTDDYWICGNCSTLVSKVDITRDVEEIKNEDDDLYGKNYWEKKMCLRSGKTSLHELVDYYLQERTIYWLRYLMKYKLPGCELAEIGGGIGQFSYLVKQAGYIQTTFELSEAICDWGRQNLNVVMHQGEISDINKEYEVIVSFDVLEHITEPKLFITQCLKHLKHSGVLCIQTPCFSNQNVSDKSNRFRQLLIKDEHVFLYSRKSIQLLLEEAGLKYFQFEPAVFGDDYDMFLFASREPMIKNTDKEIDEYLNSIEPGRLLKSMMSLYHDVNEKEHVINELVRYKEYLEEERLMQRFTRKRKNKR